MPSFGDLLATTSDFRATELPNASFALKKKKKKRNTRAAVKWFPAHFVGPQCGARHRRYGGRRTRESEGGGGREQSGALGLANRREQKSAAAGTMAMPNSRAHGCRRSGLRREETMPSCARGGRGHRPCAATLASARAEVANPDTLASVARSVRAVTTVGDAGGGMTSRGYRA